MLFHKGDDPFGATAHRSNCPFSISDMENGASAAAAASSTSAASSSVRRSDNTGVFVSNMNSIDCSLPTTSAAAVVPLGESCTDIDKAKLMRKTNDYVLRWLVRMQPDQRSDFVSTLPSSGRLHRICQQHGKLCNLQHKDTGNSSDLRHVVRIRVFSELWLSQTATPIHVTWIRCKLYTWWRFILTTTTTTRVLVVLKCILRSRNVDTRIILLMILDSITHSCMIWCVMFWIEYLGLAIKALILF